MLSPCAAQLHFSPKSSDVQVLYFGGHKAFNGSTVFPIYLGCCFYYEDLFICFACAHGGQRTACKSQISPSSSRKLNSSHWAWLQVPLPAEPSHQHKTFNFNVPPNRFCFMPVFGFPGNFVWAFRLFCFVYLTSVAQANLEPLLPVSQPPEP